MRYVLTLLLVTVLSISATERTDKPLTDESLDAAGYMRLGFPPLERPWTGMEGITVQEVLNRIAAQKPAQLPRFNSAKSGRVFARLVSEDHFKSYHTNDAPPVARLQDAMTFHKAAGDWLKCYAGVSGRGLERETLELTNYTLKSSAQLHILIEQVVVTLDRSDNRFEARMKGFKSTENSMAAQVVSAVRIFELKGRYPSETLSIFTEQLVISVPPLLKHVNGLIKADLALKLAGMAHEEKVPRQKAALQALQQKFLDAK